MFWFFGREAGGLLAPRTGIEPACSALEGGFWTTGPREVLTLPLFFFSPACEGYVNFGERNNNLNNLDTEVIPS